MQNEERARLAALDRYDILDTPQEEGFDRITRLTRRIFDVPMSTITLIDAHRQWFKARSGVEACETAREPALCNVAMREPRSLVVPDTHRDPRFARNPFVTGAPHLRFYAGVPLRTPQGIAIGTLCAMDTRPRDFRPDEIETLIDLSHVVMSELELRRIAMTDGLTGALSRRAFRQACEGALAQALRHRQPLACLMLDLDHFKAVNDGHGHPVGDRVLSEVAALCRDRLRGSDAFGRLGGEEFAILLPQTDLTAALAVAETLRAAIADLRVPVPGGTLQLTTSLGAAALDAGVTDVDSLLWNADAALYAAKAEGRNRCVADVQGSDVRGSDLLGSDVPGSDVPGSDLSRAQRLSAARPARPRVLKAGRISFGDGGGVDCTVRGLSEQGARLGVIGAGELPETFRLSIGADRFSRLCRIALRREGHLDVAFV